MGGIILFDGECNFCDASVQFIIKRDPHGYFKFTALQSEAGMKLRQQYNIPSSIDSVLVIEDGRFFVQSTAALRIVRKLKGAWPLAYGAIIVPASIRNLVYSFIAKNRYKWFGKKEECMIPTKEQRNRFL